MCIVSLKLAGMDIFSSVNYSFTTAATGGFATHSDYSYLTPVVQYIVTFFCFVAGINFTMLYITVSKRKVSTLFKSAEGKFYFFVVVAFTLFIAFRSSFRRPCGMAARYVGGACRMYVLWSVLRLYQWWLQVHSLRYASEDNKERVSSDAAPQCSAADACRRHQCAIV